MNTFVSEFGSECPVRFECAIVLECVVCMDWVCHQEARLAQSVERKALNLVVVGSSPTVGASFALFGSHTYIPLTHTIPTF